MLLEELVAGSFANGFLLTVFAFLFALLMLLLTVFAFLV